MGWLDKLERAAAEKAEVFTPSEGSLFFPPSGLARTNFPYGREVGLGLDSNVVMSPVNWILQNFTMGRLVLERLREGVWQETDSELVDLIARPNDFYSGNLLWKGTLTSYLLDGNSYWLKVRNRLGQPVELWYLPHFRVTPRWPSDGSVFISHYEYGPRGGERVDLPPRDVVHFRFGLDPKNPRLGKSPVRPLLREVFTDEEASNFSASILRNMGVPGGVISPKDSEAASSLAPGELERMKDFMKADFTGDRRGEWLALGAPTRVEQFGFDPNQLLLTNLRDISEERVCAALGVPAAVVGFGAGLQQTKVGAPQPVSARLWTPGGPTTMGEIGAGDVVAIPDGWGRVNAVYPQGEQDIYRITFQDGSTAESTADHLWDVDLPNHEKRQTLPLSEIAEFPDWKLRRASLPLQGVTEFAERPTVIPPYVMGLLLADGSFRPRCITFSNTDVEVVELVKEGVPAGYDVNHITRGDYRISYRTAARGRGAGGGTGDLNPWKDELRRLGLWGLYSHEKFVPDLYKYNSSEVRLQLLRGILDGDGYVNLHGQPALEQTSKRLADDVTFLVQSLGGYTLETDKPADRSVRFINGRPMCSKHDRYHLSIVIDDGRRLFGCSDKRDRCRPRTKAPTRKFRSIERVRREQAQCIEVDGSLYLTDNFIVTHNTMRELRRLAWTSCIEPKQKDLTDTLDGQILPDFESETKRLRFQFDNSGVPAFAEEETERARRVTLMVEKGVLRVDRAQEMLGLEVDPDQDVYLRPGGSVAVDPEGGAAGPAPGPGFFGTDGEQMNGAEAKHIVRELRKATARKDDD